MSLESRITKFPKFLKFPKFPKFPKLPKFPKFPKFFRQAKRQRLPLITGNNLLSEGVICGSGSQTAKAEHT